MIEIKKNKIHEILLRLRECYGKKQWKYYSDPLDILIKTLLSQNTSDTNSFRAFDNLKEKFPNWEDCYKAPIQEIEKAIKIGGLARVKSQRIKDMLERVKQETNGKFNLKFLEELDVEEAKKWLLSLKGVGEKTAACTLIFGFNKPIFPVDTHILRISKRTGLIGDISLEKAHNELKKIIPPEYYYELHLNLIAHGRQICHAQNPKCHDCKISQYCNFFNKKKILEFLENNSGKINGYKLHESISNSTELKNLINDLISNNLIEELNDKTFKITALGRAYLIINRKNKINVIRSLIEKKYDDNLIIKTFKISKKQLENIKTNS